MRTTKIHASILLILIITVSTSIPRADTLPNIIVPDDYSNIQEAIDNAQPYDEIWIRPGTYYEIIDIDKPLTIRGDGTGEVIIDGLGGPQVIHAFAPNVNLINLTIINGENGIYLSDADNAYIELCKIENCDYVGLDGYDSNDIRILDSMLRYNEEGINLLFCDRAWITDTWCSDNRYDGLSIHDSDEVWLNNVSSLLNQGDGLYFTRGKDSYITDSSFMGNTDNGIYIFASKDIAICNTECKTNKQGIDFTYSRDCYISKTEMSHNEKGFYPWYSDVAVVSSNITSNTKHGVDSYDSVIDLRYCDISLNNYGVETFNGETYAENCWWGDPSGPYNPTYNPTGTGNQVDDITIDPWQPIPYQPEVLISDFKCEKLSHHWLAIYPTENTEKPLNTAPAKVSDWLSSVYVTTKLDTYNEVTDTNPDFVNQVTGNNLAKTGECVLSFGGPIVNPVVKYAEQDTITAGDRAPLEYHEEDYVCYFRNKDDTPIPDANLPHKVIGNDQDMFLIEHYIDSQGRVMMICYGFGWQGTYAAGKYFETIIAPNIQDYYYEWIIVKWEDTNTDGFVNTPIDGDTYTLIATS